MSKSFTFAGVLVVITAIILYASGAWLDAAVGGPLQASLVMGGGGAIIAMVSALWWLNDSH